MEAYIRWVLKYRKGVLFAIAFITCLSLIPISNAVIGTSLGQLFFGESPQFKRYQEIAEQFGNDEVIVVAIEGVDPLTDKTLAALETASKAIELHPEVQRVQSLASAQWVRVENGDTLRVTPFQSEPRDTELQRESLLQFIREDPILQGALVSERGTDVCLVIEFKPNPSRPAEEGPETIEAFKATFRKAGFPEERIHLTGLQAVMSEVMNQSKYSLTRVLPVASLALLAVVFLLFRQLWPAVVSGANAALAILWTMGFSCVLESRISILLSVVPAVISIVSFADVIHLCSAYLIELREKPNKEEAIVAACTDVGTACLLTSLTTFLGFAGMSFVPTPAFRQLGLVLGFGTGVALLIAITLVPILFAILPTPRSDSQGHSTADRFTRFILAFAEKCAIRYPFRIIGLFGILTVLFTVGIASLEIETNFQRRLAPENRLSQDERYFKEHFRTSHLVPILLDSRVEGGALEPEYFKGLAELADEIESWPEVESTTSLVDLVLAIHKPFNADDPEAPPVPDTKAALSQYLLLFEMEGGEDLDRLIDFKRSASFLLVRLHEGKMRATATLADQIKKKAEALLPKGTIVEPTGQLVLTGHWLDEILEGQKTGLLFTCLAITAVMAWGLRSLGIGVFSMIPNLFPLLFLGGMLGFVEDQTDSDHLIIALLAISIGVDDTIHFLTRLKLESLRSANIQDAIRKTYAFAGRGILHTTVALSAGFAPFLMSDYLSTRIFGTWLPLVFGIALLADLLLVPALARVGWLKFPSHTENRERRE